MADHESSTGKSPAFQFYPKDFLSDEDQAAMTLAECGLYIRLLCRAWDNGSIPDDVTRMSKLVGSDASEVRRLWPAVSVKFVAHPSEAGRLVNPRMERERVKQNDYRRRQADAAGKRWHSRGNAEPMPPHMPVTQARHASGNALLSSSASSSADCRQQERVRAVALKIAEKLPNTSKPAHVPLDPSDDPALSDRAGRFCERYSDLHVTHRNGARYIGKPQFDFAEALQLVRVWDDERLDKLAHAFLVTDDEWVASGSRSLARFRSRASWCDDELRKKGL